MAPPAAQSGATPPGEALTDSERISRLEQRLQRGLSEFDGLILREQEGVRTRTQEHGADLPGTGDPDRGTESSEEAAGEAGKAEAESGRDAPQAGNQPDSSEAARRDGPRETAANIPPDIADGSDDDVVARQIREAAMREKDPALREKLWDEYRKYKNRNR